MGTWDIDTFDNDTACDWAYELEETEDLSLVQETLAKALQDEEELDADAACCALAACEVIARLKGKPGKRDAYTETVDAWAQAHDLHPDPVLIETANRVLDRALGNDSELRELWEETEHYDAWKASVTNLKERVNS